MGNVWAAAGGAARAENDLNMLCLQARNLVRRENDMPNKNAKEKDTEFARLAMNQVDRDDKVQENIKIGLMATKLAVGIVQLIAGGIAGGTNDNENIDASDAAAQAAQEAANQADTLSFAARVAGDAMTLINIFTDIAKNNRQSNALSKEAASLDSSTAALDTRGKA